MFPLYPSSCYKQSLNRPLRRGQIICAIIGGWALAPWEILASATGFLSFMNGYTVFLGPIAGIMVADVRTIPLLCMYESRAKSLCSTGSSTAVTSMYQPCTTRMVGTGIPAAL